MFPSRNQAVFSSLVLAVCGQIRAYAAVVLVAVVVCRLSVCLPIVVAAMPERPV